jgi:hypothetical protein
MPEIRIETEDFPMVESPNSIDPVVLTLDLDRIAGLKCEDSKLKIELKPRKAKRSKPVTIEAQHELSDKPWEELA